MCESVCWPETNRLPDFSPAEVSIFRFSAGLQFGVCNHGDPCASPQKNEKKNFFFFFLFFLGPQPWDTEVPRLGVESKPQGWKQSCSCRPTPQPQEHWLWAAPVTYAAACGNAGSLTHRVRPGMELAFSWILVRLLTCWATTGTLRKTLLERGNIRKVIVNEEPMAFHWLSPWQERKVFLCVKAPLFWFPNSI